MSEISQHLSGKPEPPTARPYHGRHYQDRLYQQRLFEETQYSLRQYPRREYQESGMWLELAKFGALLASLLCLYATFHTAFLIPDSRWYAHLTDALKLLALAAVISWAGGWLFHRWDLIVGNKDSSIAGSLPMKIFWWGSLGICVLFLISWYFEAYYLPLRRSVTW